ncbi:DUF1120 domain-containing protein [Pseudomonas proteolytica]|uniref:DUF1120 domain-containing protein n=1 Tax=Pseudomonas proteolytica TaxID=219574 RepID=UPI0014753B65|nr:DUF1120 domain-containing protein [Pseudomonas proteolytica]NMY98764.1 DUF1120 domain-containing protein [Pseudomonas proteolytica]
MKLSSAVPLVALLYATASVALAASDTELAIKGSITPSACEPLVSSDGMVDFGKISAKQLNGSSYTSLPDERLLLNVHCDGPTFFTLNSIDNRSGSSAHHDMYHGLGMTPDGEKLGGTGFGFYELMADGVSRHSIVSTDGGVTWKPAAVISPMSLTAVAAGHDWVPIAVQNLDAKLTLYTHIAPADGLTLIDEVPLDGHVTVQVNYL